MDQQAFVIETLRIVTDDFNVTSRAITRENGMRSYVSSKPDAAGGVVWQALDHCEWLEKADRHAQEIDRSFTNVLAEFAQEGGGVQPVDDAGSGISHHRDPRRG